MIIFYDPNCEICTQIKTLLETIDVDKKLSFEPITNDEIYSKYEGLNYWSARKTIHILDDEGNIYSAEDAIIKIIDQMRLLSRLNPILTTKAGLKFTALAYKALNNYRLNKMKNCQDCRS